MLYSAVALLLPGALVALAACKGDLPTGDSVPEAGPLLALAAPFDDRLASTDFSGDTAGAPPSGWTERWGNSASAWTVRNDSTDSFSGDALIEHRSSTVGRRATSWDTLGALADVRLHTRVRVSGSAGGGLAGLVVAGSGSAGSESGYLLRFKTARDGTRGVELGRYLHGSFRSLEHYPFAFEPGVLYDLVFEKSGAALRGRVWAIGGSEPLTWQIEWADSNLTRGWAGFTNWDASTSHYDFLRAYHPSTTSRSEVLVAAGDIASCKSSGDEATAALIDGIDGTVAVLGDNVYSSGTTAEFNDCYHPNWGRHKARTRPAAGNHEYETANAAGYFGYFGAVAGERGKGYYSYDLGDWHIVVLNSNCASVSCIVGSAQERWLRQDLAATTKPCILSYWHHARFSSGKHGNHSFVKPFWNALYEAGADVVLNGHDHTYERFAPQTPRGVANARYGIRQFVVGTGGKGSYEFGTVKSNSERRYNRGPGVLKLTLLRGSYAWEFIPTDGSFSDAGTGTCHSKPASRSSIAAWRNSLLSALSL